MFLAYYLPSAGHGCDTTGEPTLRGRIDAEQRAERSYSNDINLILPVPLFYAGNANKPNVSYIGHQFVSPGFREHSGTGLFNVGGAASANALMATHWH